MKFDYPFVREDYVKFLRMMNRKSNLICLFLFTIIYFIAIFDLVKNNFLLVCIFYLVSAVVLYCVLTMISLLFANFMAKRNDKVLEYAYGIYHISIDEEAIKEEIDDKRFEIKFQDVARVSTSKNYFIVYPKNSGIMYIFMKSSFKTIEKYNECKEMVFSYVEKAKKKEVGGYVELKEGVQKEKKESLKKQDQVEQKKQTAKKSTSKKNSSKKKKNI